MPSPRRRGKGEAMSESQQVICAKATGCEFDECPYWTFRSYDHDVDDTVCPVTGKPVEWRQS